MLKKVPLIKGVTAMEVIQRNGKRWLVSYFKIGSLRMYLAVIDWSQEQPVHTEIDCAKDLQEFVK